MAAEARCDQGLLRPMVMPIIMIMSMTMGAMSVVAQGPARQPPGPALQPAPAAPSTVPASPPAKTQPTAGGAEVRARPQSSPRASGYAGDVLRVALPHCSPSGAGQAWFGLRRLLSYTDGDACFASVGVPLQQMPGAYILRYHTATGSASVVFLVRPSPHVMHVDKAVASDEEDKGTRDKTPWWWQVLQVKAIVAHFAESETPPSTMVMPLRASLLVPFGAYVREPQSPLSRTIGISLGATAAHVHAPAAGRIALHINERGCRAGLLLAHGSGLYSVLCDLNERVAHGTDVVRHQRIGSLRAPTRADGMVARDETTVDDATPSVATVDANGTMGVATLRWHVALNGNWVNPLSLVASE